MQEQADERLSSDLDTRIDPNYIQKVLALIVRIP